MSSVGRRAVPGRRAKRDVGHALDRRVAGRVGKGTTVGPAEAHEARDPAVELITHEHAATNEVEALGLDPLVVVGDRCQAVGDGAVTRHVHDLRAVGECAELVEGCERRPRVRRLVSHRPVELGGMADGLVDRQP